MDGQEKLSRRQRQIMDIVYACGSASATQVRQAMPDAPTRTAVRTMLRILEEKGHLRHRKKGREFVYEATRPRRRAGQSAMRRVVDTFFQGSLEEAVAAHLVDVGRNLSRQELERLAELIDRARKEGGQ